MSSKANGAPMIGPRSSDLLTRREALTHGALGAAALAGVDLRAALACLPGLPEESPRATSVIQIWMWGGPSHLDTFDPKPDAGSDYCGPYDHPIDTNVDGIRIGQMLPRLAQQADKYSIIRSLTHGINAHETASYFMQTGHRPSRVVYPCVGSVVSLMRGKANGDEGLAPPYIVLTQPQGRFSEAGFLGQRYKPFCTGGDPNRDPFVVEGIVAEGISDRRQRARRELLHDLDTLGHATPDSAVCRQLEVHEEHAYELMFGEARKLWDLSTEDDQTRQRYGRNTFGQSCLMARRLVEAGVPYVTINARGWDTHKRHFQIMNQKLPQMDQGMAALLEDLQERGLLASTIVWWSGEFGRTPRVQWDPPWNGGRGHFGRCFSAVVAGGGFAGGHVVGASDETGQSVAERPVSPRDLIGSIYRLLGIDPDGPLPNDRGMDVTVLPPEDTIEPGGGVLREIMPT